jgi:hypothetical protein
VKEKKHIETSDLHELTKKEVRTMMRPFMIAYFTGEERIIKKQEDMENVIRGAMPSTTWRVVESIGTWIALLIVFMLLIQG